MTAKTRANLIAIVIAFVLSGAVAVAGSQHGAIVGGLPLFALAIIVAFGVQIIAYIPAAIAQTERFYDITASLTYISVSIVLLVVAPFVDARSIVLAAMVALWAGRLGTFLFMRIQKSGVDDRFDELKTQKLPFFRVWMLQALWISLTASAAWIGMTSAEDNRQPLGWIGIIGIIVWVAGMTIEITADLQKSAFKADPKNKGEFITTGIWSRSQHPNYFGEILLWIGVFIVAAPVLQGWQWVALISPIFSAVLLTKVSGIPLLEKKAEAKWGDRADFREYTETTPKLIPKLTK